MKIAIIGCGLIGKKRAQSIKDDQLIMACDSDHTKAQGFQKLFPKTKLVNDYMEVICNREVEMVIISTTNDALTPIAIKALENGKHVLLEKPGARNLEEFEKLVISSKKEKSKIKLGFNHRFHPAILKAHQIVQSGVIGELMFIRGRYGHGGRLGLEKEWRANPQISGGGELIDQGVHLIDLAQWLMGDFVNIEGAIKTYFWEIPVEDNAFVKLETEKKQVAWLHVSCTEWKNLFSLEIYGKTGKLHVEGLGGSYGLETLTHYQMLPQMGVPQIEKWKYPGKDISWENELNHFVDSINHNTALWGNIDDGQKVMKIIDNIYRGESKC